MTKDTSFQSELKNLSKAGLTDVLSSTNDDLTTGLTAFENAIGRSGDGFIGDSQNEVMARPFQDSE